METGELLGLRVSQVDMRAGTIELYGSQTKNGKPRKAIMSKEIATLVAELIAGKHGSDYLFTRNGKPGTRPAPVLESRNAWHSLCVPAGLGFMVHRKCYDEAVEDSGKDNLQLCDLAIVKRRCPRCEEMVKWSHRRYVGVLFHDLRRSAIRDMVRGGTTEKVAMTISGHATRAVFERYNIVSDGDLRDAARRQEEHHQKERQDLEAEKTAAIPLQFGSESSSESETSVKPQTTTLQ